MILDKVSIQDFKSIKRLNITLHDLTCLVGKNESGKSAILEAISFLNFPKYKLTVNHTNKNSKTYDDDGFPTIIGYYLMSEYDKDKVLKILPIQFDDKKQAIPKVPIAHKWLKINVSGATLETVEIDFVAGNNKPYGLSEKYTKTEYVEIKNKFFKDIIPNIELFTNDSLTLTPLTLAQLQQKQGSYESFIRLFSIGGIKNPSTLNVTNVEKLDDKLYTVGEKITDLLQKNYTQDKSIKVQVRYTSTQFMLKFIDASKRTYSITERSLGFQYFFAFLINKTFLNTIEEKENLFLLDEPGVSLHPEGARDLISIFEEISSNDQVIYTTHNPFLAYRKKPDNLILAKKDDKKGTELVTKVYTNKYQILRKELGLLLNDSFLVNDINLVVEGNADKWLLHYIIHEDDDFEPLTWTHIFSADTASEITPSVRYLNSLNLKGVVLLDSDDAGIKETKKPKFKKYILDSKNWSHLTLDEVFKNGAKRTIEDMLLNQKYLEAYNTYYKEEDAVEWKKKFQPLIIQKYSLPILDQINVHFKEYADGGINKIAILRKFTQLFPYDNHMAFYRDLKNIILMIQERVLNLNI